MQSHHKNIHHILIIYFLVALHILIYLFLPLLKASAIDYNKSNYSINIEIIDAPKDVKKLLKEWQKRLNEKTIKKEVDSNYYSYRFNQDRLLLKPLLESEGYYNPEIKTNFNERRNQAEFIVTAGKPYFFGKIEIAINGQAVKTREKIEINIPEAEVLNAKAGQRAIISKVKNDEEYIEKWVEKNNCLFTYSISHEAVIDHLNSQVNITYLIDYKGDKASYGDISFSGLKTIDEAYLLKLLPIKKGECFKRSSLASARLSLRKTQLIDSIEIRLPKYPNFDSSVPIKFVVTESPQHTVKFGVNYSTDIGAGASAGWEHRNLLSHGEKISTTLLIAQIKQKLAVELEKPFFLRSDQKLKLVSSMEKEDNEAYENKAIGILGSVERDFSNKWVMGIGAQYKLEQIIAQDKDEKAMLLSVPIFVSQDKRDNLLDPQKGWTLNFSTAPAFDTINISTSFIKNNFNGTYYTSIFNSNKSVFAVKAALGSIAGASSNSIPATERFYGGGSGSVRGYAYQLVGPLDKNNNPLGGRSLIELATELRFHISNNYGIVPFIDCGSAFSSKFLGSGERMLCGAGIGLRYYTSFGPIRVDLAKPLNKRVGIDAPFQLYFSIGQSF